MGDLQPTTGTTDPAARIRQLLSELRQTVKESVGEIQRIAELEVRRHGDDTLEGLTWCDFASGPRSDVGRAARDIEWQIAAIRGSMLYRGLDGGRVDDNTTWR